jgi:hypothetical protein
MSKLILAVMLLALTFAQARAFQNDISLEETMAKNAAVLKQYDIRCAGLPPKAKKFLNQLLLPPGVDQFEMRATEIHIDNLVKEGGTKLFCDYYGGLVKTLETGVIHGPFQ